jgi:surface polysaccharide O-acyltransferase-like enzyme
MLTSLTCISDNTFGVYVILCSILHHVNYIKSDRSLKVSDDGAL